MKRCSCEAHNKPMEDFTNDKAKKTRLVMNAVE